MGNDEHTDTDLLDERVEQHNSLFPKEPRKIGVGVLGARTPVHLIQVFQRKLLLRRQLLDLGPQASVLERLKLVEQWRNKLGVDDHHDEAKRQQKAKEARDKVAARPEHDRDHRRDQRRADHKRQQQSLEEVADKAAGGLLVEAMPVATAVAKTHTHALGSSVGQSVCQSVLWNC